jgi:hypothetical protein
MISIGKSHAATIYENRIVRFLYLTNIFILALTGFGQMPIYKRYYMSDIPGFGWLANFFTTRYVHYLGAVLLLALTAYFIFDYVALQRKHIKVTPSGYLRGILLAGIIITGILFVIKNFAVHVFSAEFIIVLNLCHLGFVMAFLLVGLYCLVLKKQWTSDR